MEDQQNEYAGFGQRFLALLIDGILLTVVTMILASIFGISMFSSLASMDPETMTDTEAMEAVGRGMGGLMMMQVMSWAITILYFAYFESSAKQATLGKQAMGIVVTDMDGYRISFGKAILRNIGRIISGMIIFIGYIMAAFTERKQALHDLIATTLVLKK